MNDRRHFFRILLKELFKHKQNAMATATIHKLTTQIDDSGHRIRKDPAENAVFSGAFLQVPAYFSPDPAGKAPEDGSSIPVGISSYAETGKSGKFPLPDSIRK